MRLAVLSCDVTCFICVFCVRVREKCGGFTGKKRREGVTVGKVIV